MRKLIYTALLLIHGSAAFGSDCPQNFAATSPYVFSTDDLARIKSYCNNGHPQELRPAGTPVPNEMYLYAVYICETQPGSRYVVQGFRTTAQMLATSGPNGTRSSSWRVLAEAKPDFAGVPARMKEDWKKRALKNLQMARDAGVQSVYDSRSEFFFRLKLAMPFLEPEEIQEAVRELASSRAQGLVSSYKGVPSPKLFQFTKESIRRDLGLPYRSLTDMVVARPNGNTSWSMILYVDPANGNNASDFWAHGVGIRSVKNIQKNLDTLEEGHILDEGVAKWSVGDRNYEADYKLTVGKRPEGFAPQLNSLDHAALRADGKLTGMIFPGVNMGVGEAGGREVMNEYLAYYRRKGFKFDEPTPVENFEELLSGEIKSGRLDYLVKEEHATGGSGFAQIAKRGTMKTGRKGNEVIHIFYPEKRALESEKGDPIHFEDAAGWMKARTAAGGKQLFYVDTACSGIGPACSLAMMAGDKNLVIAGGADSMDTFTNSPASPLYHVLEGVRGRKDFPSIEAAMKEANTEGESIYLLPHSPEWKQQVLEANPVALNAKIEVRENGRVVDVETVGR